MKKLLVTVCIIQVVVLSYSQNIFISTGNGTLYKTNPNTCVSTFIGNCPTFVDIAFLPNGKLYGQTWGSIYEVDTTNATTTLVMNVGSGNSLVGASNGKLYAVSGNTLIEIDVTIPSSNIIGTVNCSSGGDLAIFNDTLYLACSSNNLLKIDINNPSSSFSVGNMSISGSAYGLVNASAGCTDRPMVISSSGILYSLNYNNGAVSSPCNIGVSNVYGAASPYEYGGGPTNFLGANTTICNSPNYVLYAPKNTNYTYLWSDNSTADSLIVSNTANYWVQLTDTVNICTSSDTISLTFNNAVYNDTIINICNIGNIDLNHHVIIPPGAYWLNSSLVSVNFPQNHPNTGTFNYYYVTPNPCSDTILVTTNILYDSIHIGNDTIFCSGGLARIGISLPGFIYNWSTGASSGYINVTNSGTYYLDATSAINGCILTDTVDILVLPVPNAGNSGQVTMCDYTGIDLFNYLSGNPNNGGIWYNMDGSVVTMPFVNSSPIDGNYSYIVTNGVCHDTSIVQLTNIVPDLRGFTYSPSRIIEDQTVVNLTITSNPDLGIWYVEGIALNNLPNIQYKFKTAGFYDVCIVLTNDNCVDTVCEEIEVVEDINVFAPNSFTPNDDGFNDEFAPIVTGDIENYHLYIFDRWGGLIFETDKKDGYWNGKDAGGYFKNDTYTWRITYKIPQSVDQKEYFGQVLLVK